MDRKRAKRKKTNKRTNKPNQKNTKDKDNLRSSFLSPLLLTLFLSSSAPLLPFPPASSLHFFCFIRPLLVLVHFIFYTLLFFSHHSYFGLFLHNPKAFPKEVRMSLKKSRTKARTPEEEELKLNELRSAVGPLGGTAAAFCTDRCLFRYLRANNWSHKKSLKMLKETISWREKYRPEEIRWEEVAKEAETGKIYRASFCDRNGRTVLIMRPSVQNTNQIEGQIRYLVYCMENAIMNLPPEEEQMVWLVDFEGWSMTTIPVMTVKETANVLQNHYPERLGYAIMYNPPKIFETFWNIVKPFLDPKTQKKVKFVYPKEEESKKLMEQFFDSEQLESAFGGKSSACFDKEKYATVMKEDDMKLASSLQEISSLSISGE